MFFVYSTLSTDVKYTIYGDAVNDMPKIERVIEIKGGANVAGKNLVTPSGVVTEVSGDDADLLSAHPVFQRHVKNGFMKIERYNADPDKVSSDMTGRDDSAPLTDNDFNEDSAPIAAKKGRRK